MNLRILTSSTSNSGKSALLAYQRLPQSTMMPVRKPVGRTFCPMNPLPLAPGLALETASQADSSWRRAGLARDPRDLLFTPELLFHQIQVGARYVNVAVTAFDRVRRAAGARHVAFQDRPAIDPRLGNHQVVDVAGTTVLGVADGNFED